MIHDPLAHAECLQFIRAAIAQNDPQTARDIASVLAEVCVNGHASREAIWRDLSPDERERFRQLLSLPQ